MKLDRLVSERMCAICAEVGVDFEEIGASVRARMQLLADHTETIDDCTRIAGLARTVFEYYERHKPSERFSAIEKRIVVVGSLFADIGKTGPVTAEAEGQRLIVEMFAVEGVRDDQQSVAQFFTTYFPADSAQRLHRFQSLGLDAQMSMRAFWNHHTNWTFDIVRDGGVPMEAVAAAATHHLLDNINPEAIVGADGNFSIDFGDNVGFDRAEKLVILLDKYDAVIRRGHRNHTSAVSWLRELLNRHPRFATDTEFSVLLNDLDVALRDQPGDAIDGAPPTKK
jgi:hypothetical protein